jgi:hypothetical protein
MKNIKTLTVIFVFGAVLYGAAYSHEKDHGRGPGNGGDEAGDFKNHFGLSDSCWNVFIGLASKRDTMINYNAIQTAFTKNTATIDSLRNLLDSLFEHQGRLPDSTVKKILSIISEIRTLVVLDDSLKRVTVDIVTDNIGLFDSTLRNCGKPMRDTTRDNDSTETGDTIHVHHGDEDSTHLHHGDKGDSTDTHSSQNMLIVSRIWPNPSQAGGTINLDITLTQGEDVKLTVTNQLGIAVKTVDLGTIASGEHTETLDLSGISAGSYILSIRAGTETDSRMIKVR